VLGSYLDTGKDTGGKIRVDVRLQDAREGETIAAISQDGNEASLPELVTQSGTSLRQKLGIADVSATEASQVAASTSASPEATRLYAEGLAKLQAYEALAARDLLEKGDRSRSRTTRSRTRLWLRLGPSSATTRKPKKRLRRRSIFRPI
jgi:eukaryotic-like serine/threonine-protein kinase